MADKLVVLDTNVFVAAGFNPRSHSAQLIDAVREGKLHMAWSSDTRREIHYVLRKIPHLRWRNVNDLFRAEDEFTGDLDYDAYGYVADEDDRKFLALATAADAALLSLDDDLLSHATRTEAPILTPAGYLDKTDLA